ncbi:PH domain-containing protein [Actinomadura sp. SCN-SB]|uniref:PH domain-containing protein n=1 Tax=Actinomadura sp. SCN-SB TaxID=3373092 RepID=UPI0037510405
MNGSDPNAPGPPPEQGTRPEQGTSVTGTGARTSGHGVDEHPAPVRARLHPLTFVVGAAREMVALLAAGVAGLAVGGLSTAFFFTLIGLGLGFVFHVIAWATFTYTVYEDRIELRRSLIGRSVTTIPRERIRGVDISAALPHRLLGLAIVHIDAGADGGEGTLNAVGRHEADRLRGVLLGRGPGAPGEAEPRRVLARMPPRWFVFAPLSGAYLLTPFALAGSLIGTLYNLSDDLGLITRERLSDLGHELVGLPTGTVLVLAVLFLLAMPVTSALAFAAFNWDFRVYARDGSVVAERGLVTRRSVSLERRRIRGVELTDNPFERLARVQRLGALVTGLGDAVQRGRLFPAAPRHAAVDLAGRVLGPVPGPLVRHPPAARGRRIVRAVAPPLGLAVLALFTGQSLLAYVFLGLSVLAVPLGVDRYRQLGHATDESRLAVRSGSLRRRLVVVDHGAVVGWRLRRTLFQRRLGLATLDVAVGAGEGGYPAVDMAEHDAVAFAAHITPTWVEPFLADERRP